MRTVLPHTVGIDAAFCLPGAPRRALISWTGFPFFTTSELLAATEVFPWVRSVLLSSALLLMIGALFLRQPTTTAPLAFTPRSRTVVSRPSDWASEASESGAVFHVVCHTLVKSSLFLQMAVVRQVYDNYRINRIGDYIHINRRGCCRAAHGLVLMVAFRRRRSSLSELMIQANHRRRALVPRRRNAPAPVHRHLFLLLAPAAPSATSLTRTNWYPRNRPHAVVVGTVLYCCLPPSCWASGNSCNSS